MIYYVELHNTHKVSSSMQGDFPSEESAKEYFLVKYPNRVQIIYDENFKTIYEDLSLVDD